MKRRETDAPEESHDSGALQTEIVLEVLSDLTNETLEGQLAAQEFNLLLVTTYLTESDSSRPAIVVLFVQIR